MIFDTEDTVKIWVELPDHIKQAIQALVEPYKGD